MTFRANDITGNEIDSCYGSGIHNKLFSPSIIAKITEYIRNQSDHHKIKTFQEEYKMLLDAYGGSVHKSSQILEIQH